MSDLESLLSSLQQARLNVESAIANKRAHGETFNVFELCGVGHYETMHSSILAEFLSPNGSHGMEDALLRKFSDYFSIGDYSAQAKVITEESEQIGGESIGRFDILIKDESTGHICIIENKIYAGEQPEQLGRYGKWLDSKAKEGWKTHLVFLTLDGHESITAEKYQKYAPIAYSSLSRSEEERKDVVSWLKECARLAKDKPFVHNALLQYADHLENLATGERAMSEKIIETLWSNMKAAQDAYEHYAHACECKANTILKEEVAGRLGSQWSTLEGCSWKGKEQGIRYVPRDGEKLKGWIYVLFDVTQLYGCQIALYQAEGMTNSSPILIDGEQAQRWKENGWNVTCHEDWSNEYPLWRPVRCGAEKNEETYQWGAYWDGAFFDRMRLEPDYRKAVIDEIAFGIMELYDIQKELSKF